MAVPLRELHHGGYTLSNDKSRIDVAAVHAYLSRSYWAEAIPRDVVEKSIAGSVCFGVYEPTGAQVGFARVVTDCATFGYLADVFVLEEHRGRGLSKALMAFILAEPGVQGLRRFLLCTRDAHGLYAQFGFKVAGRPENIMEIVRRGMYREAVEKARENRRDLS